MLRTIGINASCAQCRRYIVAAKASTVRATLRILTCESVSVDFGSARARMRRIGSGMCGVRWDGQPRLSLKRLVDGHACLRTLGCCHDRELHIAGGVADDVHARNARFTEMVGLDCSLSSEFASEPLREVGLLRLRAGDEHAVALHQVAAV